MKPSGRGLWLSHNVSLRSAHLDSILETDDDEEREAVY